MTFMDDVGKLTAAIIDNPPTKELSDGTKICHWCELSGGMHYTSCPVSQAKVVRMRGHFDD